MTMKKSPIETEKIELLIARAAEIAHFYRNDHLLAEHVLAALVEDDDVKLILQNLGLNGEELVTDLENYFTGPMVPSTGSPLQETPAIQRIVLRANTSVVFSSRRNDEGTYEVLPRDIFVALMHEDKSHAVYFLARQGVTLANVKLYIARNLDGQQQDESDQDMDGSEVSDQEATIAKAEKYLEKFCTNLNEKAKNGKIDPLIGREHEVDTLVRTTARRTKNNVIMVGEPGVGKTAIAEGLAKKIIDDDVPDILKGSVVYSLDVGSIVAGAKFRGDFEERMKNILKALSYLEKPILFIDEIHMIMGAGVAGSQGGMDIANLLKPALAKGELRCIGSTTYDEYRKYFEKDRALLRRFQPLDIKEPSTEDARRIIAGLKTYYEEYHGVEYSEDALDAAVELTSRYIYDRFLPDKAVDVLDAAGARQRVKKEEDKKKVLTAEDIELEVSLIAKVPRKTVQENETEKLEHLEVDLGHAVFDQDDAVRTLADVVIMARAGLRDPGKPLGSYLFTGPTGVGKTEVAKQLSKTLGMELVRFDMSEYMEKHTISKLIGSPPGYVGYADGASGSGLLISALEKTPHCILLLDEVEKAHPDVLNILLQVMDNGVVTSSSGKAASAKNCILIMTSNAGASELEKNPIGLD